MRSPRRPAAASVLGAPAGASGGSVQQQLDYWIKQTSQLSDTLIESQMRASQAEAEAARLAPLETQWPVLAAEARSLSEAKADALVENARLAEWNEQLRLLGATQDQELQQLRRLLADKDAHCAHLQAQLSSAQTAHSAAASSMQLQQAYQSKLIQVETALADAQRKVADQAALQFNYQVLHAKYEQLKKLRAGHDENSAEQQSQLHKLVEMNRAYQRQMENVCDEVEKVRTDLLVREEERAALIDQVSKRRRQVSTLSEQNALYRSHVDKANGTIERLQHGMMVARTRLYQAVGQMRAQHVSLKRECAFMLAQEQERTAHLVTQLVAHVSQQEQRGRREQAALQATLHEDHLMHNLAMQQQERKLAQLMDFSTGTAATAAYLQRDRHAATRSQQQPSGADHAFMSHPPLPPLPSPPPAAASSAGLSGGGFDVRDWLSLQTLSAASAPRPAHGGPMATPGPGSAASATRAPPAPPSDPNYSFASSSSHLPPPPPHRVPAAAAVGQSPQAPSHALGAGPQLSSSQLVPPTFSLPSSLASSIHPHRSAQVHPLPPHHQALQPPPPANSNRPAATSLSHAPSTHGHFAASHPSEAQLFDPSSGGAGPPPPPLSRSIHVQRLAEVEAALQAMAEM